jgi:hypothetical protein
MLYKTFYLELDYDKLIEEAIEIESVATDLDHVSNKNGGVQIHERNWKQLDKKFYIETHLLPSLSQLLLEKEGRKCEPYIWLNINYPGSYNSVHTHSGRDKSGVFYVKTPENCGNLVFTKTDEEIVPEAGLVVTFNIDTGHAVTPNFSDDTRISFAFNY